MQHLFINVPKYVNHHMFIYVSMLSELEKRKGGILFLGKARHPRKSAWLFQRSENFSVTEKSCGIRVGFRPSNTNLYVMGITAHSSRIRPGYVYFKVAVVNVWQQMDSGPALSLSCKFT